MAKFKIQIRRTRRVEEVGYIVVEADNILNAKVAAYDADDPPMEETSSSIEHWRVGDAEELHSE